MKFNCLLNLTTESVYKILQNEGQLNWGDFVVRYFLSLKRSFPIESKGFKSGGSQFCPSNSLVQNLCQVLKRKIYIILKFWLQVIYSLLS